MQTPEQYCTIYHWVHHRRLGEKTSTFARMNQFFVAWPERNIPHKQVVALSSGQMQETTPEPPSPFDLTVEKIYETPPLAGEKRQGHPKDILSICTTDVPATVADGCPSMAALQVYPKMAQLAFLQFVARQHTSRRCQICGGRPLVQALRVSGGRALSAVGNL